MSECPTDRRDILKTQNSTSGKLSANKQEMSDAHASLVLHQSQQLQELFTLHPSAMLAPNANAFCGIVCNGGLCGCEPGQSWGINGEQELMNRSTLLPENVLRMTTPTTRQHRASPITIPACTDLYHNQRRDHSPVASFRSRNHAIPRWSNWK